MVEWVNVSWYTVDGRNPAPVDMVNISLFTRFYTSQVPGGAGFLPSTVWVHMNYIAILCSITLQYSITSYLNTSTTDSVAVVDDSDTLVTHDLWHFFCRMFATVSTCRFTGWPSGSPYCHCYSLGVAPFFTEMYETKTFTYSKRYQNGWNLISIDKLTWYNLMLNGLKWPWRPCASPQGLWWGFPWRAPPMPGSSFATEQEFESLPSNG